MGGTEPSGRKIIRSELKEGLLKPGHKGLVAHYKAFDFYSGRRGEQIDRMRTAVRKLETIQVENDSSSD